ncbi:MAG: FecR domain-containing protein [Leptospira sp.]|nr:FecR domain-containing protein [Leptospira sp.]
MILVIFSFLLLIASACKGKSITDLQGGVITNFKGDVKLFDLLGKQKAPVKVETFFLPTDELRTGKASYADIQLMDGVIIRVKENSIISIKKIFVDGSTKQIMASLSLDKGSLFSKISGKLGKNSLFKVATPTTVAAVRGTEFAVEENGKESETLVNDGSVSVTAVDDKGNPVGPEVVAEEGKKVITDANDKMRTTDLTEEEKKELREDSQTVQSISEDAKARINDILKDFEENKARIKQSLEEQKESNRAVLEGQKSSDKANLEEQKAKDKAELENVKGSTESDKADIKSNAKSQADEIKKGKGSLKDQLAPQ